ncbi:hypothetical protein CK501_06245 [Halovibrio salipaludis]|uniref:DUF1285 domain-containing protein n=1 Tax=Halovibrio salipaludis TaxID=2032626 RepID=A0A2A2F912_9GAMM|nr:DUF1285 domain-containing protein [Halovibrio salipaludis]PAU81157.1 hypothetical protein CK501_06245 [Halovibrio salipaludis]
MGEPDSQAELARQFEHVAQYDTTGKGPPVDQWDPPFTDDLELFINRNGRWFYQGREIERLALRRLFASIMRRESDGYYYLLTPHEKYRIQVEDVPFLAHSVEQEGEGDGRVLWLHTDVEDCFPIGDSHPLIVRTDEKSGEPQPYVMVRRGLQARIERSAFYHLTELAEERAINGATHVGVVSQGSFFSLGRIG